MEKGAADGFLVAVAWYPRKKLEYGASDIQHMQKALTEMNVQLHDSYRLKETETKSEKRA